MTSSAILSPAQTLKSKKSDPRQPDQTRKKIVKTAEKLMWFQGYDGASLNDVVKKAGVSKGALFHYYPSKQAITLDVLDKYAAEQLFAPFEKFMNANTSLKSGLLAWLQNMFDVFARGNFKGGCLLGNTTLSLSDRDDEIREKVKSLFLQWENQMVGHFKPAAKDGVLTMEPRQFARLLIAQVQGVLMLSKAHKDSIRSSREFQAVAEVLERLIKD
jgi:TetR/AcrR family transcriptional repressor of nem operon